MRAFELLSYAVGVCASPPCRYSGLRALTANPYLRPPRLTCASAQNSGSILTQGNARCAENGARLGDRSLLQQHDDAVVALECLAGHGALQGLTVPIGDGNDVAYHVGIGHL